MTHDEMLIAVVYEAYDKHCHACSMFVATHALHIKTLQEMKHYREATILQVIGLSWEVRASFINDAKALHELITFPHLQTN